MIKSSNLKNVSGGEALLNDSMIRTSSQVPLEKESRYNCITQENEIV